MYLGELRRSGVVVRLVPIDLRRYFLRLSGGEPFGLFLLPVSWGIFGVSLGTAPWLWDSHRLVLVVLRARVLGLANFHFWVWFPS